LAEPTANKGKLIGEIPWPHRRQIALEVTKIMAKFSFAMKRLAISAVLFSAIAFLISACASHDEGSGSQSAANVPGERVSDEGSLTPGAAGSSATVHW